MRRHIEDDQARWLMTWARANARMHPELNLLFHCPNGGWRDKREAARLKSMGVRAGVSDYFLPVPKAVITSYPAGNYKVSFNDKLCGLWLELKSEDGKLSGPQAEWGRLMIEQGYEFEVCKGWVDAARAICDYLGLPDIKP
jgi:hypothetical protein